MPKKIDLCNQRFGRLLVISEAPKENNELYWNCKCDCGVYCIKRGRELRRGHTQSCGCLRDELLSAKLEGYTFGRLTVLNRSAHKPYDGTFWECKCSCGNIITVPARNLKGGRANSCGCLSSRGEERISSLLRAAGIEFQQQVTFKDCKTEKGNLCKFDFGIIKDNKILYVIEYDGSQHFEESLWDLQKIQRRDLIKNKFCLENNIPLIRIPYTHLNNLKLDDLLLERTTFNVQCIYN